MRQLALDGREVAHPLVVGPQLNPRQRAVLTYIRERDVVRTAEVGRQIHVLRGVPCRNPYTGKGLSQEEIGQRLIFAQSTVGDVLRNRGVRARRRRNVHARLDDDTILRTMELYGRGYSAREVGDLLGVTEGAVLYRVHRYGRGGVRHGAEAHTIPGARRRNRSAAPVSA
jgi:hypothetical protein